jgi:phosphopentomutase
MGKTVIQALSDEVLYPISLGKIENILIRRGLESEAEYTSDVAVGTSYKGALADCLSSLLQAVNFSEADKSIGALNDRQRKAILKKANRLYKELGEPEIDDGETPMVYINC